MVQLAGNLWLWTVVDLPWAYVVLQGLTATGGDQHTPGPGNCGELVGFGYLGCVGRSRVYGGVLRWCGAW